MQSSCLKSLTAPEDSMWQSFTRHANQWEISSDQNLIGYASVDGENQLLQFYIEPQWLDHGPVALQQFIELQQIKSAMVCTNNPMFLSLSMHFQKKVSVHTYLFEDVHESKVSSQHGTLRLVLDADLSRVVEFYHQSIGAPKEWLNGYLGNHISRGEIFVLEDEDEILGACEVRSSDSYPSVADVGMVVSANHRRKGIGAFLLGKAKELAYDANRKPICSCEKDNLGSLKSIQKNGFRSVNQMLLMEF